MISADDPAAAWRHHHDHEVNSAEVMKRCIAEHFIIEEASSVPYLYRYLIPTLPATSYAAAFVPRVLQDEAQRGRTGQIAPIVGASLARRLSGFDRDPPHKQFSVDTQGFKFGVQPSVIAKGQTSGPFRCPPTATSSEADCVVIVGPP